MNSHPHPRLSLDRSDFSRFKLGPCRWFTGSGWRDGKIRAIHKDHASVKAEKPAQTVVIYDARNIVQEPKKKKVANIPPGMP